MGTANIKCSCVGKIVENLLDENTVHVKRCVKIMTGEPMIKKNPENVIHLNSNASYVPIRN